MPFKQAFGSAALPVAGASAVAIAAAIGYFIYTGTPKGPAVPSDSVAVTAPLPKSALESEPSRAGELAADDPLRAMPTAPEAAPLESAEQSTELEVAPAAAAVVSAPEVADALDINQPSETPPVQSQIAQVDTPEDDSVPPVLQAPKVSEPSVDIVRIPPNGISTVAGRADPGTDILIYVDGVEVARAKTGASGEYVALFDIPSVERPREMQVAAEKNDARVFASGSIIIAPFIAEPSDGPDSTLEPAPKMTAAPQIASSEDTVDDTAQTARIAENAQTEASAQAVAPKVVDVETETNETETVMPAPQVVATVKAETTTVVPKTQEKPRPAPTVMIADDTGVKILQSAAPLQGVSIDAITYDPDGAVFASGRGTVGTTVRLYLNNTALMDTLVGSNRQWRANMDVDAGIYSLRADMVDAAGKVLGRVEIPFKREDVAVLKRLAQQTDDVPASVTPQAVADAAVANTQTLAATQQVDADAGLVDKLAPQPRIASITVQPGNTLWGIASDSYGDGFLYARVFNANVAHIRDPDLIYPGQVFVIPQE